MAHYLITGHTGFKGSWLTLLLKARGHQVSGLSLDPLKNSLFNKASISDELSHDLRVDIRDRESTVSAVKQVAPDFVIHMAAQALVREGYRKPLETYDTNVNGTLNVLYAVDSFPGVRAQLIVTSDKVYEDRGLDRPFVESDPLGGRDPYSASKAMADILSQQWLGKEKVTPGAIARAGNVIGAGDFAYDRLMPDIMSALRTGSKLLIRHPNAVRPWQHVLDCLDGYLLLLDRVSREGAQGAWNFGPKGDDLMTVEQLLATVESQVGGFLTRKFIGDDGLKEDYFLAIDASQARQKLGWKPVLTFERAIAMTVVEGVQNETRPLGELVRSQVLWHVTEQSQLPHTAAGKK